MYQLLATSTNTESLNVILLIGIATFGGTIGARLFQRLHIPQIVGYITIGIILGPLLNIISQQTVQKFEPFNLFTMGIIGFVIGGELKRDIFVKFGKQVTAILLFEGLVAFLLVASLTFLVMWCFVELPLALAVGIVFGAICAATDPASTMSVLWEYKTRGPLTTMLTTIVALDDALALILYITSVSVAGLLTGHKGTEFFEMFFHSFIEIIGSLALGITTGFLLRWIVKLMNDNEKNLVFTLSTIILCIGLSITLKLDIILASMALGATFINLVPQRSLKSFDLIRKFSPPIYVLFFVLIGAKLNISGLTMQIWLLTIAYIFGSVIGKTTGSYIGAAYSKAAPTIKKYLGFCLYQQGTIAIALLIMASKRFQHPIPDIMLSVVVLGVLIFQLTGPLFVKIGTSKAGETGLNITEEDLIEKYKIADVIDKNVPVIPAGTPLSEVIKVVSSTNNFYYSVVDSNKKIIGAVTLDGIRNTFTTQELNDWLVALDIAEPLIATATPDMSLSKGLEKMKKLDIEYMPIVVSEEKDKYNGILDQRTVYRRLSAEVLAKQKEADAMYALEIPK